MKSRWGVFAVALAIRGVVAFVFFGSIDVTNSMADAAYLIGGVPPSALGVPHLPGVHLEGVDLKERVLKVLQLPCCQRGQRKPCANPRRYVPDEHVFAVGRRW